MITREIIVTKFKLLQDSICECLTNADGLVSFKEDIWYPKSGGFGRSRIIEDGKILEKGGVNFTEITGKINKQIAKKVLHIETKESAVNFYATGVSIVIHPLNPFIPIIHMNVRYFEIVDRNWWFGGGIDLTPHYIDIDDAKFFHKRLKAICDNYDAEYYQKFKKWADDYFFIPHRKETRGVGGIFFDRLSSNYKVDKKEIFNFVMDVANAFNPIYVHLINKNKLLEYSEKEKQWQSIRRGRYVEFNLVYDRGTKFGLETNGRVESILMSLPKNASWLYNFIPTLSSKEQQTIDLLKKGIDWINFNK